jgi:hypothetical protein
LNPGGQANLNRRHKVGIRLPCPKGGREGFQVILPLPAASRETRLRTLAQHWERLLFSTGERLELSKCFFYIISWKWLDGKTTMKTNAELNTEILLTCGNEAEPVRIQQKEVTEAHKTLGTHMRPTGNMQAEAAFLKTKSNRIAGRIASFTCPKWLAALNFNSNEGVCGYLP